MQSKVKVKLICYSALKVDKGAQVYMARTKQRRTYLP